MMGAGLITPPVGLCVYTVASVAKDAPLEEVFKGALPFLIAILFVTFLITLYPQIALFLPGLMENDRLFSCSSDLSSQLFNGRPLRSFKKR